jgi:hypothetical protein
LAIEGDVLKPAPLLPVQASAVGHNARAGAELLGELMAIVQPVNIAWQQWATVLKEAEFDPGSLPPAEVRAIMTELWEQQKPSIRDQLGLSETDADNMIEAVEAGIQSMVDRVRKLPDALIDEDMESPVQTTW